MSNHKNIQSCHEMNVKIFAVLPILITYSRFRCPTEEGLSKKIVYRSENGTLNTTRVKNFEIIVKY